ncbi:MAG: hypothetical protein OXH39_04140 [Candidatus Poribacteria bacterium]|nr:hypothetical protein [Candidatus Poribacteria bacterium]
MLYIDATPTGLMMRCYTRSIQMPPLRGLIVWGTRALHRCHPYGANDAMLYALYTDAAPTGLGCLDSTVLYRYRPYRAWILWL